MNYKSLYEIFSDPWKEFSMYNKILHHQLNHRIVDTCSLVYMLSNIILNTKNINKKINGFSFLSLIGHLEKNQIKYSYEEDILKTIKKLKLIYFKLIKI